MKIIFNPLSGKFDFINDGVITGTATSGQIAFWDSSTNITGESNLYWDSTNDRIGVNTTTPRAPLHVGPLTGGNGTAQERLRISGDWTTIGSGSLIRFTNQIDSGTTPNAGEYNIAGIAGVDDNANWGGALYFQTANTGTAGGAALTTKMVISANGNVGIGTTSPSSKLHVTGGGTFSDTISTTDGNVNMFMSYNTVGVIGTQSNHDLQVRTSNTERMRITSAGNVGIGTTSPFSRAQISDSVTGDAGITIHNNAEAVNNSAAVWFKVAGSSSDYRKGAILFVNDGTGHGRGSLFFVTNNSANSSVATSADTRMAITAAGNVGIGTTSPAQRFHVNGISRFDSTVFIGPEATTGDIALELGQGRTGNGYAYIDLVGDTTYTDYGLRFIRNNTGANASSEILHRGTGDLNIAAVDAANIRFTTNSGERLRITSAGNVGINQSNPGHTLDVNGSINASTFYNNVNTAFNVLRNNLGNPTVEEKALFHGQFNNKFRFIPPTLQEESTDGVNWTTSTRATANQLGDMMIGEGQVTQFDAIPTGTLNTYGGYRLTWDVVGTTGYVFLDQLYIFNSTNGNNVTLKIEAFHNTTGWTTISTQTSNNWPGHWSVKHTSIPYSASASQYSRMRLTFETNRTGFTNAFTLYAIEWFGGYPSGRRNVESYDRSRNVFFPGTVQGSRLISTIATGTAPLSVISTTAVTNLNADMVDGYHSSSLWRSDGGVWNPSANITLGQTANNQEWSFDITRNGFTGGYWHVWDSINTTMLKVDAVTGKVSAPYNFVGNLEGSAATLTTARTLTIGSTGKTFNGSADVSWTLAEIGAYASTNPSGFISGNQTITLSGVVTGSGTTAITTAIANGAITNAMLANSSFFVGTTSIALGRASAAQTLTGVSIDGNAGTVTNGVYTSRTITINGTTQDLSADRTFNVGTVTGVTASTPLSSSGGATPNITISQASGSTNGFLSSTDWTTFNSKQNALTNPVTGTGTTNYVTKWTSSSAVGNSQIFDNGTNVGVGTTSPASKLHVDGTAYATSFSSLDGYFVGQSSISQAGNSNLVIANLGWGFVGRDIDVNPNRNLNIYGIDTTFSNSQNVIFSNAGSVGIGTTNPTRKLDVDSISNSTVAKFRTSDNNYSTIEIGDTGDVLTSVYLECDSGNGQLYKYGSGWGADSNLLSFYCSNGPISFQPNGTTRMFMDTAGNVGIGTASPSQRLHVSGSVRVTGGYYDSANSVGTSGQVLSSTGTGTAWIAAGTGTVTGTGSANRIPYWSSTSNLTFNSNLYWDNTNSRLGIGTTAPSAKIHLVEGNFVTRFLVGQSTFTGYNSGLTAGQKGNIIVGQANSTNNAYVINFIYQGSSSTSNAIGLGFYNNDDIVVITGGKNVGIATTSPNTAYTTTIASLVGGTGVLLAQGSVKIDNGALGVGMNASATVGRIDASNDIVPFSSSDLRLKENIKNIESPIEKVKKLNGIEFDWIKELEEHHGYSGHDTGVIAQEVQDVLPTAVRTNASGYLAVRYEKLIGLLIEAVKEQQAEIDYLKSKL